MNAGLVAALVALAVYTWVDAPSLARVRAVPVPWAGPAWLSARPDAPPSRQRAQIGVLLGAGTALLVSRPVWLAALAGLGVASVVYLVLGRLEPRRLVQQRDRARADLPTALDLLDGCVAAGLPLRSAVAAVGAATGGPLAELLERVTAHTSVGFSDAQAWQALSDDPVLGALAKDLARGCDSGTALRPVLQQHAAEARSAAAADVQARARALGVRTIIPVSACFLPAFLLVGVVPILAGLVELFLR